MILDAPAKVGALFFGRAHEIHACGKDPDRRGSQPFEIMAKNSREPGKIP
jgi:hypothetical protein